MPRPNHSKIKFSPDHERELAEFLASYDFDKYDAGVKRRLNSIRSELFLSWRDISARMPHTYETARNSFTRTKISVDFLYCFSRAFGVNPNWLISGEGPKWSRDLTSHYLKQASIAELYAAIGDAVEQLHKRQDQL